MAKVELLEAYQDIDYVKEYAIMFGMDPDFVYAHVPFNTVVGMLSSRLRHDEYTERYREIKKWMDEETTKNVKPQ